MLPFSHHPQKPSTGESNKNKNLFLRSLIHYIYFNLHFWKFFLKRGLQRNCTIITVLPPMRHAGLRHDRGWTCAVDVPGVRERALQGEVRRVRDGGPQCRAQDHRPGHQEVARQEQAWGDLHQGATDYERYRTSRSCHGFYLFQLPMVDFSNIGQISRSNLTWKNKLVCTTSGWPTAHHSLVAFNSWWLIRIWDQDNNVARNLGQQDVSCQVPLQQ